MLFDSITKTYYDAEAELQTILNNKIFDKQKFGLLFDVEVYDKIKFQEAEVSNMDFRNIIIGYIEFEGSEISLCILKLITEKIQLDTQITPPQMAFYIICIIYCLWKDINKKSEPFMSFIREDFLICITEVLFFCLTNVLGSSSLL